MVWEHAKQSVNNLIHRKLRSFLNVLSILIGIAAIFALVSFGQGLSHYVDSLAEEMGKDKLIAQAGSSFASPLEGSFFFSKDEVKFLGRINGVDEISAIPMKSVEVKKKRGNKRIYTLAFGMPTGEELRFVEESFTVSVIEGRKLKKGDKFKAVLGYNYLLPDKIFKKPVKKGEKILVNGVEFEVVGFYEEVGNPQDDSQVYMTIESFEELFPESKDKYQMIIMRASPDQDPSKLAEKAQDKLRRRRGQKEGEEDFYIQTFEQAIQTFSSILDIINSVLVLIALISVVVAGVNIMNTMYTAVLERTKEIGIMKAIGAKNSDILAIFVIESGVLGLVGSAFGIALGYLIASSAGAIAANAGYAMLKPIFPAWLIIGCMLFGFFVGSASGFLPARQASKLKPVDALRYE